MTHSDQTDSYDSYHSSPSAEFCARLKMLLDNSPLAGLRQTGEDSKENLRALAASLLGRLNVVSREEFDAQSAILAATTARVEQLEAQVAALQEAKKKKKAE